MALRGWQEQGVRGLRPSLPWKWICEYRPGLGVVCPSSVTRAHIAEATRGSIMKDYDVIIIGGGINGLTVPPATCRRRECRWGVFEARGQCGAFCDTIELGIPGFLHNTHASWIVPAMSPPMADLELESYGLDLRGTSGLFGKPFLDGKNMVYSLDLEETQAAVSRHSQRRRRDPGEVPRLRDGARRGGHGDQRRHDLRPAQQRAHDDRVAAFNDGLLKAIGAPIDGDDVSRMSGFEIIEVLFESEAGAHDPGGAGRVHRPVAPEPAGRPHRAEPVRHDAHGGPHRQGGIPRPHPRPGQVLRRPTAGRSGPPAR